MNTHTETPQLTSAEKAARFPAQVVGYTHLGPIGFCSEHFNQIMRVYTALGYTILFTVAPKDGSTWCTNCEGEHNRREINKP
jgi:hypothetical protein